MTNGLQRRHFSPRFPWVIAVLLALTHVVLALTAISRKCVAFDEIAHIVAGQSYWEHHDFRLHPENGILPQRIAALPSRFMTWRLPPPDDPAWAHADIWRLANRTFYELGNDTDFGLLLARSAVSLHAFGIVLLVFAWARRLFGFPGAFTSAILCVLSPTLLAHGPLATSDVAMAFWMLAATGAYWRFLHAPSWRNGLVAAACLGFAAVAKFSAVLLAPICVILWAAHSLRRAPSQRQRALPLALFGASLVLVLGAMTIVWSFYEWRRGPLGTSLPSADYFRAWPTVLQNLGNKAGVFTWLRNAGILPDPYVYGLANVVAYSQARGAFLNGEFSTSGWVSFFPYAFLVKTAMPVLAALAASGVILVEAAVARFRRATSPTRPEIAFWPLVPLFVLLLVYWTASLASHLNIGHRHLLPVYPSVFILCGAVGQWAWRHRWLGALGLAVLGAWSVGTAATIYPHYLPYFNAFAGGPSQGYRHLVESSLDWGLDLPALGDWLHNNRRHQEAVYLAYFGMGNPHYEGIEAQPLPSLPLQELPRPTVLKAGLYAISATMLQQPYSPYAGPWTIYRERRYQELRNLESLAADWESPSSQPRMLEKTYYSQPDAIRVWAEYDNLRFARLCHYLRTRTPDARVGYSILIFRLAQSELDAALHGSVSELIKLIEAQGRLSE